MEQPAAGRGLSANPNVGFCDPTAAQQNARSLFLVPQNELDIFGC